MGSMPDGQVMVEGASEGFVDATKTVAWVAALFVFLGLLTSFLLPRNAARSNQRATSRRRRPSTLDLNAREF
jgi:hypothetical protein